jgi:hypothetical protein
MPEVVPVMTARWPDKSTSARTCAAVEVNPNGVVKGLIEFSCCFIG